MTSFPCTVCNKEVKDKHKALICDVCSNWVHIRCNHLDNKAYKYHEDHPETSFTCFNCLDNSIPFTSLNHNQFNLAVKMGVNYLTDDSNLIYLPKIRDLKFFRDVNQAIYNNIHNIDLDEDDPQTPETNMNCKYYGTEDFAKAKFNPAKTLSIFHLNIHSMELHSEGLNCLLNMINHHFDFLCISESKIRKGINPKVNIDLPGYQPPEGTPTEANKGGVLIYVKQGINYKPRPDLNIYKSRELESFFIEVIDDNGPNFIVGVIYRHPCMNTKSFNDDYLSILAEKLSKENKLSYISGDFNFDLLKVSSHSDTLNFLEIMMTNFLLPTITVPTRLNPVNNTLIDNIFTNDINPRIKSGNLTVGISDHLPSFTVIPKGRDTHIPKNHNMYKRDTKNFDRINFILDFLNIDWKLLELDREDVNFSTTKFFAAMNDLTDKHMPLKKVSHKEFKQQYKPWITHTILRQIEDRNKLLSNYAKCKDPTTKADIYTQYKQLKNIVTDMIRKSKKDYYQNYFTKHKEDLRKTWQGIREIINIKNKNTGHPTCINDGDKNLTDPTQIANKFNDFYVSIADNILKDRKYNGHNSFKDYLQNPLPNSFFLEECTVDEIKTLLYSVLNPKKSTGPNSVPVEILHTVCEDIAVPITALFNLSFKTGQYPDLLKIAKTIPIYKKKGSKLLVANYRPISLLSNINKILEKLMFTRIYNFLEKYKCIFKLQFGFRSKHSTNHALIHITETIRTALDGGNIAGGIFVDLQKAFDTVNHEILVEKLAHYGIRGTANNWFLSYLSNRSQFVSIAGCNSDTKSIKHGVPQGSVLGPLLFLIYINDLHKAIRFSHVYHFADDTNLLNISSSPKQLQKQINIDLKLLYKWLLANKISLNCSKTELIIFQKPGSKLNFKFKIKMNGHKLSPADYIKYLGVYLDSTLSGSQHCALLSTKLNRAKGMLSKIRHYVNTDDLKSIYHAIFSSHMIYGAQIWGQSLSIHNNNILRLQNKAMKILNFANYRDDSDPHYVKNKIIKINDYVQLQNCLFVYDFLKETLPDSFNDYFTKTKDIYTTETVGSTLGCLFTPFTHTTRYGLNSITRRCITSWNFFSRHFNIDLSYRIE